VQTFLANDQSISVVIPTFKRCTSLPAAIYSALCQGQIVNEVIVIDDNRDDLHSAQVKSIVKDLDDSRVIYLQNKGRSGGSASRNIGIKAAKSPFIAFLDDDDYWLQGKLVAQLALMISGIVGVDCGYIERDDTWGLLLEIVGDGKEKTQMEMLKGYCPTSTSLVMLRREVALRAGLFDENMASFEDFDFWLRCTSMGNFANLPEPKCVYVQHSGFRLSVAIKGRLEGLDEFIKRWGSRFNNSVEISSYRSRWRMMSFATNSRRTLSKSRIESLHYALEAIREAPLGHPGWQALLFCAMGFRAARFLSRSRNAKRSFSQDSQLGLRSMDLLLQSRCNRVP